MKPALLCALLLGFVLCQGMAPPAKPAPAAPTHQVRLNGHTFTLPVGFTIELVAGPPLIDRPIMADFDEEGRLYVAEASGTNDPVQEQLKKKPHRILRLEDTKGNGQFDKRTVFADKMMFPEGVLWYDGSLYVAAAPSIWKLTDTDGDGVADQRTEWFQGKTLTGCANDLHGPYLGPDGWLYWCKGAFAKQTYERPGKPHFTTRAAHIFRARPDGTGLEPVMTGGMDNPVEVVFTPGGERIFTTTFLQHPAGGKRDGLIHAVYGGIYGKDHDPIYEHPWTAPTTMPVMTHLGAAAPSGLVRYESEVFGKEYKDNLFAMLFNLHKVTRHILIPEGATFRTVDADFLVSDNLDFHPTDVLEDADGSLLVIDTGGWYKLCCPTSQLHKPDVLGGIYRIRKTGAAKIDDPRGRKLAWGKMSPEELASLLDDPRPAVRKRAIHSLAKRGTAALPALRKTMEAQRTPLAALNAVWTATRIPGEEARAVVRLALRKDADETVQQAALHSVGLWRDSVALDNVVELLRSQSSHVCRAAAEALGRIGQTNPNSLIHLFLALEDDSTMDRVMEHSLTYALIEFANPERTKVLWRQAHFQSIPRIQRAGLMALDQMPNGGLKPADVMEELSVTDPAVREAAWWIVSRHPEWGKDLADVLAERLLNPAEHGELERRLPPLARNKAIQELLEDYLYDNVPLPTRLLILRIMAQANLKTIPPSWLTRLQERLTKAQGEELRQAVSTLRAWPMKKEQAESLRPTLLRLGTDQKQPLPLRLQALAVLPSGLTEVEPTLFALLCQHVQPEQPVAQRALAADILSRARLRPEQLRQILPLFKTVGPMEIDRLVNAFAQTKDEQLGMQLIAALKSAPALSALRTEVLKPFLAKYSPRVQKEAQSLYALLDVDAAQMQAKLERLLTTLPQGDIRRGQAVFHSPKAACVSCHAIGYQGGTVGPDLTHVGRTRSDRDLLEAIVFPNASFVRSYEPVVVLTKEGKIHNGILRKETPEEIILAVSADQQVRLSRNDIEEMKPSKVSLMPSGLEQQLTPQELADVVAFLRACK
jgi:putative membrane-bound dehydrogenase-like protein